MGSGKSKEKIDLKGAFSQYLSALRKTAIEDKTEHTDRAALEQLLQAIASDVKPSILVQHEPKRTPGKGAPDFKVSDGRPHSRLRRK